MYICIFAMLDVSRSMGRGSIFAFVTDAGLNFLNTVDKDFNFLNLLIEVIHIHIYYIDIENYKFIFIISILRTLL